MKKSITNIISNSELDEYYQRAMDNGALGGKLLGAGGGGFLCFYSNHNKQESVKNSLSDLYNLECEFENAGTQITYYDQ